MQETQETQVQSLGQEEPLEEEMATHSGILACKVPWTAEPGRLQTTGSQRDTTEQLSSTTKRKDYDQREPDNNNIRLPT